MAYVRSFSITFGRNFRIDPDDPFVFGRIELSEETVLGKNDNEKREKKLAFKKIKSQLSDEVQQAMEEAGTSKLKGKKNAKGKPK